MPWFFGLWTGMYVVKFWHHYNAISFLHFRTFFLNDIPRWYWERIFSTIEKMLLIKKMLRLLLQVIGIKNAQNHIFFLLKTSKCPKFKNLLKSNHVSFDFCSPELLNTQAIVSKQRNSKKSKKCWIQKFFFDGCDKSEIFFSWILQVLWSGPVSFFLF